MKHTVLIVIGDLDIGGAERHLTQILPRLNREHFQVVVCTLTHKGALAGVLEAEGILVIEPGLGSKIRRMLQRIKLLFLRCEV